MNDNRISLIQWVKGHAKAFLEDTDEFFPFAVALNAVGEKKSIGAYPGNDYPDPNEVLGMLEQQIIANFEKEGYVIAAIGLDVLLTTGESNVPALQIKIFKSGTVEYLNYPYEEIDGKYVFNSEPE